MPKVSVIIATYNRAHFIRDAIDSVMAQSFTDYEIIVADDGSSDTTQKIVNSYGARVRYFYQTNQGKAFAQNMAASHAQGDYLAFLDDDDIWYPNKLEIQIKLLEDNLVIGFVCSESYLIDEKGNTLRHWTKKPTNLETFESLYDENFIQHSSVVVRKGLFHAVGGVDERLATTEDYDLWLRLAKISRFKYINAPLVKYRQHATNKHKNTIQKLKDRVAVVSKPEYCANLKFLQKRLRVAREYYIHAQYFQDLSKFKPAAMTYFMAILKHPLVGLHVKQLYVGRLKSSLPYRLLLPYLKVFYCLLRSTSKA
jgi:glycosyltransferase involved in cell wall biosynthesis